MAAIYPFGLSAILSLILVGWLARTRRLPGFADRPNHRSLHTSPVSRLGGLGLFMAAGLALLMQIGLIGIALPTDVRWLAFGAGLAVLIALGVLDDRGGVRASWRLLTHAGCSMLLLAAMQCEPSCHAWPDAWPDPIGPVAAAKVLAVDGRIIALGGSMLLLTGLVWLSNLFNFMDGSDGLAGSTALLGFSTYALLAPTGSLLQVVSLLIAGSSAGFLTWNWSPARIFLGDAGSVPLGWAAGALGILGAQAGYWAWPLPLLLFLPFVMDATATLMRRLIGRQRFWEAHRDHAYQRLVLSGWSHRRVALLYAALMLPAIVTAGTTRYLDAAEPIIIWTVIICGNAVIHWWACHHHPQPT